MPRVTFMCGPAGSGKSTYARRLEAEGALRLSVDQEAWAQGYREMPVPPEVRAAIQADLREPLLAAVAEGRDVVLDLAFWPRDMRDEWRAVLVPTGIVPATVYLATDRATCLARVEARTLQHGDDFRLDPATASGYFDHFEPPTPEEGPSTVVGA